MDLVSRLPWLPRSARGHDANWVIVDRLIKSAHFLAIYLIDLTDALSWLYIRDIF